MVLVQFLTVVSISGLSAALSGDTWISYGSYDLLTTTPVLSGHTIGAIWTAAALSVAAIFLCDLI